MKFRKIAGIIFILGAVLYSGQVSASGTLSGIGLLVGEEDEGNPDIYQVTLPTGDELAIMMDPEGLLSISETGEYDSSWAGKIHMKENGGAVFVNRSSFPVMVRVGISIEQDLDGTPSSIALLEKDTFVDDGEWPQMYLAVIPGAEKIQSISDFTASDKEIPVLTNGDGEMTTFSFLLDASEYVLDEETNSYVLADDEDNYDSASFVLGGRVNKNADWSDYIGSGKEDVVIRTVYTIQRQDDYDEELLYQADGDEEAPYALIRDEE